MGDGAREMAQGVKAPAPAGVTLSPIARIAYGKKTGKWLPLVVTHLHMGTWTLVHALPKYVQTM